MSVHRTGESFAAGGWGWLYVLWKCFRNHQYAFLYGTIPYFVQATIILNICFVIYHEWGSCFYRCWSVPHYSDKAGGLQSGKGCSWYVLWHKDVYESNDAVWMVKHMYLFKQVMQNPERLSRERVAEDFIWVQWDSDTQRLFYLTARVRISFNWLSLLCDRNIFSEFWRCTYFQYGFFLSYRRNTHWSVHSFTLIATLRLWYTSLCHI